MRESKKKHLFLHVLFTTRRNLKRIQINDNKKRPRASLSETGSEERLRAIKGSRERQKMPSYPPKYPCFTRRFIKIKYAVRSERARLWREILTVRVRNVEWPRSNGLDKHCVLFDETSDSN